MKPLEPLLPGETRSEYLNRLEAAENAEKLKLTDDTMREIYGFAHARRGVHPGDLEAMVRRILVREREKGGKGANDGPAALPPANQPSAEAIENKGGSQ